MPNALQAATTVHVTFFIAFLSMTNQPSLPKHLAIAFFPSPKEYLLNSLSMDFQYIAQVFYNLKLLHSFQPLLRYTEYLLLQRFPPNCHIIANFNIFDNTDIWTNVNIISNSSCLAFV